MSLSSVYFSQVGPQHFVENEFVRTFYEPHKTQDTFLIQEQTIDGIRGLYVSCENSNPILQCKDCWTLPRVSEETGALGKLPTAGTAFYAHAYTRDSEDTVEDNQNLEWCSLQDVIKRFQSGLPLGIEVLHAALKIANAHEERLVFDDIDPPLESLGKRYQHIQQQIIKSDQLTQWEKDVGDRFPLEYSITQNPENPFIREARILDESGELRSYAVRKGYDSQDSICFCWHGGQIFMAIRLGIRASLSHLDSGGGLISIEGVAGSLEEDDTTAERILLRAMEETREELGIEPAGTAHRLGIFFTAAEITAEKSTSVLVEVNPEKPCVAHHAADEIQDTKYIELDDLLLACDQGIIIDERLEVSARLLKAIYRYHDPFNFQPTNDQTIGVLGGSFDPFHNAHLQAGEGPLAVGAVDTILYVPTAKNPLKAHAPLLTAQDRIDAIASVISEFPGMYISTHEIDRLGEGSRTVDSIKLLKELHPEIKKLILVGGTDLITSMHRWYDLEGLLSKIDKIIFVQRDGFSAMDLRQYKDNFTAQAWQQLERSLYIPMNREHSSTAIKALMATEGKEQVISMMPQRAVAFLTSF